MATNLQMSGALRDARVAQVETIGTTTGYMIVFSGAQPSDCAQANSGTTLVAGTLPSNWLGSNAAGAVTKSGTWSWTATSSGTAAHFRLYNSQATFDGTTCFMQGTAGLTSGYDLNFDNNVIAAGQVVTVNTFTLTDGNA